ncbi:MAG TPA: hypothetical protein VHK90_01590 [Thermoanaerobaculia bacterium]|nr:hypothetical protein [Thermoanaerobaculia bacterium]
MKKLLIAAALMVCAAGAYASNFRGADQVYIPIAGHSTGGSGTFISDVYLANLTSDEVSVSVIYQPLNVATNPNDPSSIGTEFKDVITLQPFERKEYKDFFTSVMGVEGFGQIILNGCKKGSNCGPTGQDDEGNSQNYRAISAESRIYLVSNNPGTTGQLFSGIPWYNFVSMLQNGPGLDKVFITGVTHTANSGTGFRSNIGLVNASEFSTTTLGVILYKGTLSNAGKVAETTVTLTPLENTQKNIPSLFPNAPFGGDYFVVVEQRSSTATPNSPGSCDNGCPAFLAYGSVLDNVSGDATTLEPQYLVELSSQAIQVIYPNQAGKQPLRRAVGK